MGFINLQEKLEKVRTAYWKTLHGLQSSKLGTLYKCQSHWQQYLLNCYNRFYDLLKRVCNYLFSCMPFYLFSIYLNPEKGSLFSKGKNMNKNENKNTIFSTKVGPIMTIRSCQVPVRHKTVKAHNVVKIFLKEWFNFIQFHAQMFSMKFCLNSNIFLDFIFHRYVSLWSTVFPHIVSSLELFPPLNSFRGQNLLMINSFFPWIVSSLK